MKQLFEKTKINQMELKNRFVRSATWEGLANTDGSCSEELTDLVVNLAKGQVGLIISSAAYVSRSGKGNVTQLGIHDDEVYYREAAKLYKKEINVPLILVGGIRSFEVAKELVEKEQADYIALSRPLIREPGLIKRWRTGDTRKATCISCNQCYIPTRSGEGLYCVPDKQKH